MLHTSQSQYVLDNTCIYLYNSTKMGNLLLIVCKGLGIQARIYQINLFWVFLRHFQDCTGHSMICSVVGRGNQYIQLVKILYCKLPNIDKQLPTFPHKVQGLNCQSQRWEASVLPRHHHGP